MFRNDLLSESILWIESLQLQKEAFAKITRANSDGIEILNYSQGVVEVVLRVFSSLGKLLHGSGQVAVLVKISNDALRKFANRIGTNSYAQLPGEVIGEPAG